MWIQRRGRAIRRGKGISVDSQPFIIGIGGSHSGAGKTTVAEALLKSLTQGVKGSRGQGVKKTKINKTTHSLEPLNPRTLEPCNTSWGAIKYTKTAIYTSIVDDPEILTQEGKDTQRLLNAGAENVLWVQSPAEELKEVLPLAVSRLSHLRGIIIEGNSAIEFLKPDIVIFIFGKGSESLKKSAIKVMAMADIILFQEEPSIKLPERAKKFKVSLSSKSGLDECMNYIRACLSTDRGY